MRPRSITQRKTLNGVVTLIAGSAAVFGLCMLVWILYTVVSRGIGAINWDFFTQLPKPPGMSGGGVANAILGTVMITAAATIIGVPIGMMAGIYLSEFGQESKFANTVRFVANIMMGAPSIVIGVFAYTIIVLRFGFSGYAGAIALAIIMLPIVTRTTEDILKLVPNTLRESALALGAPEHKMIFEVVFRAAKSGLVTGVMLAVARVSGETAPLLFTAVNSKFWNWLMVGETGNLTVTINDYAKSAFNDQNTMAWGASLLITAGVLFLNITARLISRDRKAKR
ncbi:MAG: phosphate ABC transporter permease PstA [Armatimonadetes bacterium]|nr:phosphate ABC transporter permease PstA [Armatimonadota bacterium]